MAKGTLRPVAVPSLLVAALLGFPDSPGPMGVEAPTPPPSLEVSTHPGDSDPHPEIQSLRRELEGILTSTGNSQGRWAVLAVSLDRLDTLLALNPHELMVPASNMKVLSTAAAFHYLGPEFRFRTFLLTDGARTGEVLEGDLILFGTGDPTFSERFFPSETAVLDTFATRVLESGIREVRGDLVVDGSFFQGPDRHPEWDPGDLNDAFAAAVSAVSLAENLVTVRVEAGGWEGAHPSLFTIPEASGIPVINTARTVSPASRSRIWLFRETPFDPIGIEGEIPLGGSDVWRRLPVPEPLRFTGLQLKRALEAQGVRVTGSISIIRDPAVSRLSPRTSPDSMHPDAPKILATQESPPLLEILRIINKESHNFFAETVAKTMGRTVFGEGSFSGGSRAVEKFLTEVVGVAPEELQVRDGSGLSMENQASAGVFIRTLQYMESSPYWADFLDTLPEAGFRPELGRMYRSPAARNLRAKTGTMDGVSALSGLVHTRSGERILFSILSNDVASEYRAKRAEDQIGIRLASLTRPFPNSSP